MWTLIHYFLPLLAIAQCSSEPATATYVRTDETGESLKCDKCPPGSFLLKHCTKDSKTKCGDCPNSTYTEVWNYVERCRYCNRFCTEYQIESVPCGPKNNRECECKQGLYMRYGSCFEHSKCPPGEGVTVNGTPHTDVKCTPCPGGYFSSDSSNTKACQEFSVCQTGRTAIHGNDKHDVYCSACKNGSRTATEQDVCDQELMEFMTLQILSQRKQKRLLTVLRRKVKGASQNESTLELLQRIKNHSRQKFVNEVHDILERVHLVSLGGKVKKWFPLTSRL